MYKIIQNYSIILFPILLQSMILAFYAAFYAVPLIIWGAINTIIVLPPLLHLSRNKAWHICFLFGVIGVVLIYAMAISLPFIVLGIIYAKMFNLLSLARLIKSMTATFLPMFLPFNIIVIFCFLLNDIYAKKIEKLIQGKILRKQR